MAESLLLHYRPADADTATWSLVNSLGELTSMVTTGPLADAADIAAGRRCIVLLDASCVHLNQVSLPISNRQKMLRAVPFALEEQIADEVEDFHFVVGKTASDTGTPVAGIRRDQIEQILAVFTGAGIYPDAIIPDVLCLTGNTEQWCILQLEQQMLVQFETSNGTIIDADNLLLLLQISLARESLPTPQRILLFHLDGETPAVSAEALREHLNADAAQPGAGVPEILEISYNTHPLVVFCGQYTNAMPLNLLQGSYKPKRRNDGKWQRWRPAAALALVWLTLYLGGSAFELGRLDENNSKLRVKIEQLYKKSFPESTRVVNARVQMEQKLEELRNSGGGSDGDFLTLLGESTGAVSKVDEISLMSLSYRNSRMDIELSSKNLQAIENLNRFLNQNPKLAAEIVSSTSEKTGVKGNLRIQGRSQETGT